MVTIQGEAEEMLTSRQNGGCDPRGDSASCSRLVGRDAGRRNTYSLSRLTGLHSPQLPETLKRWEGLTSGRGYFSRTLVGAQMLCVKFCQYLFAVVNFHEGELGWGGVVGRKWI